MREIYKIGRSYNLRDEQKTWYKKLGALNKWRELFVKGYELEQLRNGLKFERVG